MDLLEKDYSLTNEILSSIILLKKSFVNYLLASNLLNNPNPSELVPEDLLSLPIMDEKEKKKVHMKKRSLGGQEEEEKNPLQSEEEKFSGNGANNKENNNETEAKSIDLTQPTRGDKETLSISTDASSFDDLNTLFEKNNRSLFDNNESKNISNSEQNLYLKEIDIRLKFLRNLFEISLEMLEVKHIKILWEVLVVNSMNEQEKDYFFNFFHSIIYSTKDKYGNMKEDAIYYIYFDILLKIDYNYYNIKAFFCFEAFFLFINKEAKLISFTDFDSYVLQDADLIGLEHVWELYMQATDKTVSNKAGELLIKIFKFAEREHHGESMVFETLKQNFLDTLINYIKIGYLELQSFPPTEENEQKIFMVLQSLILLMKLIEESEGAKGSSQGGKGGESLQITVMNQLNNALNPKKFDVSLNSRMTLGQAKAIIAKKLNPPQKPEEILFMVRGSLLLDDQRSLYELRIENKLTVFVTKSSFQDEEIAQQPMEIQLSPEMISAKVIELKEMFGNFDDDLIKFILEKKKFNENEVAMVLLDEKSVEEYKDEFHRLEKEKMKEKQKFLGLDKEGFP